MVPPCSWSPRAVSCALRVVTTAACTPRHPCTRGRPRLHPGRRTALLMDQVRQRQGPAAAQTQLPPPTCGTLRAPAAGCAARPPCAHTSASSNHSIKLQTCSSLQHNAGAGQFLPNADTTHVEKPRITQLADPWLCMAAAGHTQPLQFSDALLQSRYTPPAAGSGTIQHLTSVCKGRRGHHCGYSNARSGTQRPDDANERAPHKSQAGLHHRRVAAPLSKGAPPTAGMGQSAHRACADWQRGLV
jgi:hypothetical protein